MNLAQLSSLKTWFKDYVAAFSFRDSRKRSSLNFIETSGMKAR
jgi:hypothetical protein